MSIKFYATYLCIPKIQNYNGVCTNGFPPSSNNLHPPIQVADGWFMKETLKNTNIPHTTHTEDMYQLYQQKERDT